MTRANLLLIRELNVNGDGDFAIHNILGSAAAQSGYDLIEF